MSIRPDHALTIAIAKACGIPTDDLIALTYEHDDPVGIPYLTTTHYVWKPDTDGIRHIVQRWTLAAPVTDLEPPAWVDIRKEHNL